MYTGANKRWQRQSLDMQKARQKQAKLDEWERKHDYRDVRSRMRLSLYLKVAEAVTNTSMQLSNGQVSRTKDIVTLICRVQTEENDSYCWPGFTNDDLGLIKLQGTAKTHEIALRYNSAMAVLNKKGVEEARQKQEIVEQARQERKTKFVSAVRSKPTNDVAQGPNGGTGFQTHRSCD